MGEGWCQAQPLGRRGGHEAVEFGDPNGIQRIESAPERVVVEMARLNAWGNEERDRLILEKMRDEMELLIDEAKAVEPHGFDRMACGHKPHFRVLLGGSINDFRDAKCFKHPRDQTQVI